MGELANRRSARDLWVSRSHLWAMGAGTLVLAGTAFAVGFTVGMDRAPVEAEVVVADDGVLVELLARVEASSQPHGGIDTLTFPDALAGVPDPLVEVGPFPNEVVMPVDGNPIVVEPASLSATDPVGDAAPAGAFTLELARTGDATEAVALRDRLRAGGIEAWIALELVGGAPVHRVAIGGYADESAAAAKLAEVAPKLQELSILHAPAIAKMP